MPFQRQLEPAHIVMQRLQVDQFHLPDGAGAGEFLRTHDVGQLLRQFGHLRQVQRWLARGVAAKAAEALDDVCGIADLAQFAIGHDRHAVFHLQAHALVNGGLHHTVKLCLVVRLALVARQEQRHEFGSARQTADMGGIDHRKNAPLKTVGPSFMYAKLAQA